MSTRVCLIGRCKPGAAIDFGHHACTTCLATVLHQLGMIEQHLAGLTPERGSGAPQSGIRKPGFGSASPARDDIIVMLDPRSAAGGGAADDDPNPALSVPAVVGEWCRLVWVQHEDAWPATLALGLWYLREHLGWLAQDPVIEDFAGEVRQLYGQMLRAVGDAPPRAVASCTELYGRTRCAGPVFLLDRVVDGDGEAAGGARCGSCGRTYRGLDLVRLQQQQEAS